MIFISHANNSINICYFSCLFQQASGIFGHLKDIIRGSLQQEPTPDLNTDTLEALATLQHAQAQEAIYRKAVSGMYTNGCH